MHEVSIAQALVQTLEESARAAGLAQVTRLNVELGPEAGVTTDALSFALDLASRGTVGEGAVVEFSGPGAMAAPELVEAAHGAAGHGHLGHDHPPGHDHDHGHTHEHDGGTPAEQMARWTVRLAWIEGT